MVGLVERVEREGAEIGEMTQHILHHTKVGD